jgi:hypothetical protein
MKEHFNKKQVAIGIKTEMEHTTSRRVAKRIALDHLREHPQYYTYLLRMEREMKKLDKKKPTLTFW